MNKSKRNIFNTFTLVVFLLLANISTLASTISGTVTDQNGEPLSFATLYINGTTKGTTTNIDGQYIFELSNGTYELIFQYIGYKKKIHEISIDDLDIKLNVVLERETFQLEEVVITADEADPAYAIIRDAIKRRKYHKEEVQAYKCNVYIKGMQTLSEKRDKVFGYTVPVDTGIVYLSESISELSFEQPDKIKEVMVSSKVSGNIATFSYNQGSQMLISFYDNLIKVNGLSERSFVSPISNNALMFYDYQLEGITTENELLVNKIKVTPKRNNDPTFEGYIYIIEDSWRIHSVNLTLTKEHQIEFLNRINIRQVFAPVQDNIWMMISQKFNYDLNAFGFKGEGNFIGIHSNYEIQPKRTEISGNPDRPVAGGIKKLFPKKYFSNEVLSIDKDANQKDNSYWNAIRPIPLTKIEKADYQKNDRLKAIYESKTYKDSADIIANKISFQNILYSGYTYQKSWNESYINFDPIIETLQYNTVEGWVIDLSPSYTKLNDGILQYRVSPALRYGFSSERFYAKIRGDLYFDPNKFSKAYVTLGNFISQLDDRNPITYPINTFETLIRSNNYAKVYENRFAKFGYQSEITNGIFFQTSIEYTKKSQLNNNSEVSLFGDGVFTSNQPVNIELNDTAFETYNSLLYFLKLRFDIKRKYITRPEGKILYDSPYPRFEIYYRKAISGLGTDANFDKIDGLIAGSLPLGLVGDSQYAFSLGLFLRKRTLFFPDFHHFNSDRALISRFNLHKFQLLDYYKFSTDSRYYNINYRHHFNGFLINKIPFLRKSKIQAVASLDYLNTPSLGNYLEYGIGLEHIFKILRVDYYSSSIDGEFYRHGFRVGIGF